MSSTCASAPCALTSPVRHLQLLSPQRGTQHCASLHAETAILTSDFVHPTPALGYAKVEDVVAAFVSAITDPNPKSNFGCYLIPDQWGVYRMNTHGQL